MNIQHIAPHIVASLQSPITGTKFSLRIFPYTTQSTVDPLACGRAISFMARIVYSLSKDALIGIEG